MVHSLNRTPPTYGVNTGHERMRTRRHATEHDRNVSCERGCARAERTKARAGALVPRKHDIHNAQERCVASHCDNVSTERERERESDETL